MRVFTAGALIAVLAGGVALPAEAQWVQGRSFAVQSTSSGWLGVSLNGRVIEGGGAASVLLVESVMENSPAQAAGIRSGDRIVEINGRPVTLDAMEQLRTEPGDRVRLKLERDEGEILDVELVSIPRPDRLHISREDAAVWDIRLDSMTNRILLAADSLKGTFRILSGDETNQVVLSGEPRVLLDVREGDEGSRTVVMESLRDGESFSYRWRVPEPGDGAPFGVFFKQNEATAELLVQRRVLQEKLNQARRAELARQRELVAALPGGAAVIDPDDDELVALREAQATLQMEFQTLNEQLARISLETLAQEPRAPGAPAPQVEIRVMEGVPSVRHISPYIMGDRFVAGAELTTLNPSLAQYFPVDQGVLITEVIPGSPAARSGFEPGDVIIRVDGRDIAATDELRQALAAHSWDAPPTLTVMRQNEEVRLPLRR